MQVILLLHLISVIISDLTVCVAFDIGIEIESRRK